MSILFVLLLAFFVSTAQADTTITIPTLGITIVAKDGGCDFVAAGTVSARKAGALARAIASAKNTCLTAQARVFDAQTRTTSAMIRARAEAKLITDVGDGVKTGQSSVFYATEGADITLATGTAAEWSAYGQAINNGQNPMVLGGYMDQRFITPYILDQGRAGFMNHPAMPGSMPMATATSTSLTDCQHALYGVSGQLEKCRSGE